MKDAKVLRAIGKGALRGTDRSIGAGLLLAGLAIRAAGNRQFIPALGQVESAEAVLMAAARGSKLARA